MTGICFRPAAARLVLAWSCLALTGCDDRSANVSGRVLIDGKPITITDKQRGLIVFRPVAGGPTCSGLLSPSGTFEMATGGSKGLTPGDYMVSVRVLELVPADTADEAPSGLPITPAVYADPLTSGLVFSVNPGRNEVEIKLSSDAGPAVAPPPENDAGRDHTADDAAETGATESTDDKATVQSSDVSPPATEPHKTATDDVSSDDRRDEHEDNENPSERGNDG